MPSANEASSNVAATQPTCTRPRPTATAGAPKRRAPRYAVAVSPAHMGRKARPRPMVASTVVPARPVNVRAIRRSFNCNSRRNDAIGGQAPSQDSSAPVSRSPPTSPTNSCSRLRGCPCSSICRSASRPFGHQLAAGDDAHVAAQPLDDLQHVRGQEHGGVAAADHAAQQLAQAARRHRVHALERLVQEQQARVVDQGAGQRQLLAHAVRVTGHQLARVRPQLHRLQQVAAAAGDLVRRQTVDARRRSAGAPRRSAVRTGAARRAPRRCAA